MSVIWPHALDRPPKRTAPADVMGRAHEIAQAPAYAYADADAFAVTKISHTASGRCQTNVLPVRALNNGINGCPRTHQSFAK